MSRVHSSAKMPYKLYRKGVAIHPQQMLWYRWWNGQSLAKRHRYELMPSAGTLNENRGRFAGLQPAACLCLFPNDVPCPFVNSQSQEDQLPKLVVESPLGELDL